MRSAGGQGHLSVSWWGELLIYFHVLNIISQSPYKNKKKSSCCILNVRPKITLGAPISHTRPDTINPFMGVQLLNWLLLFGGYLFSFPSIKSHPRQHMEHNLSTVLTLKCKGMEILSQVFPLPVFPLTFPTEEAANRPDHMIWSQQRVLW